MNLLLTGATGYIGKRLLPVLVAQGHHVVCGVRDPKRFNPPESIAPHISVITIDLLDEESLKNIPQNIDAAYYLVHSMSAASDYKDLEKQSAIYFREAINKTQTKQVIYLSGIVNDKMLSEHLNSRQTVEHELDKGTYSLTTLRAGIIIGSGSASFEIIRDLVEKLPVMITPRWLNTKCQPIGITDVISFLSSALNNSETFDKNFDIGGPDILTYKEMLLQFAEARGLERHIYIVPVMTPRLSSYWLYFVTSTSYKLAIALVNSMKVEVVCRDNRINDILGIAPVSYKEALSKAFKKVETNEIISSWKDALSSGSMNIIMSDFIQVPTHGCFIDSREQTFSNREECLDRIWRIGGETGWYYGNRLWKLRGFIDKLYGGVGLRRGRTHSNALYPGDALDFWRVLYANKEEGRLLLFAEMKLPGDAWLEFKIKDKTLIQTATFRPVGISGRLYWYSVFPFHGFIFKNMLNHLTA
ncbi:putative nucleoside-diphosphate-sugar epimerase [Formosa agariphila KMM 3901]|uniref:Putative nucleoside-diphosphate-sugar epimerase n=1 Tax=Formosa agariphila (strain DSM 15362 / KCTC 12365 / LMG 23005 / KMM 3901 / M-2Alg 35-1) TaxID=1347342 RepID=T2KH10_FORAG|nr:SDR family oxidoreductase [Formosa agariphila]CDF78122.1 putative nucleoside-diphosphate-sugar epimerase [Formosa agariphila KMM 3901]